MTQIRTILIMLVVLLMLIGQVVAQIPTQIPVSLPINGYFLLGIDNRLLRFNTYDGNVDVITEQQAPRPIEVPLLNRQGTDVVYLDPLNLKILQNFGGGNSFLTISYDPQRGVFAPQDWSPDGTHILGRVSAGAIGGYELQVLNPENDSFTTLRRYEINEPLDEDPTLEFFSIDRAHWNPVEANWIALQLSTYPVGSEEIPADARFGVTVNLVLNHVTGETLLLNDFLPDRIDIGTAPIWSPDGRYLLTETVDINGTSRLHILEFRNTGSGWTFDIVKSGIKEISSVEYWLGVDDFIIERNTDSSTQELIYRISQIIDGQLLRQEFLRIPLSSFSEHPSSNIYVGSWYLTAETEERQTLSCLFDQAQPTRLAIGTRARVNFTNGTPLRLRTEPDFDASEIMQMPEGTEFTIIGGKACVNSSDYYRFWQLQLDDGTVGWAAEANTTDYFIEPAES